MRVNNDDLFDSLNIVIKIILADEKNSAYYHLAQISTKGSNVRVVNFGKNSTLNSNYNKIYELFNYAIDNHFEDKYAVIICEIIEEMLHIVRHREERVRNIDYICEQIIKSDPVFYTNWHALVTTSGYVDVINKIYELMLYIDNNKNIINSTNKLNQKTLSLKKYKISNGLD